MPHYFIFVDLDHYKLVAKPNFPNNNKNNNNKHWSKEYINPMKIRMDPYKSHFLDVKFLIIFCWISPVSSWLPQNACQIRTTRIQLKLNSLSQTDCLSVMFCCIFNITSVHSIRKYMLYQSTWVQNEFI